MLEDPSGFAFVALRAMVTATVSALLLTAVNSIIGKDFTSIKCRQFIGASHY